MGASQQAIQGIPGMISHHDLSHDFAELLKAQLQYNTTTGSITLQNPVKEKNFEFCPSDQKVDWGKFCMWLRGFLAGIEGKPLTPEDIAKIMEKLAYVDPDRIPSYQPKPDFNPFVGQSIPYNPSVRTIPTWVQNGTATQYQAHLANNPNASAGNADLINSLQVLNYADTIDRPDKHCKLTGIRA